MRHPRHVGLNALFLDPSASGGPETYLRGLAPALAAEFPATRFTVVTTRAGARALQADGWADFADVRALPCDEGQRARRMVSEQVLLPALARRERLSVVHSLASVAPIRAGRPSVITLHDVTFFRTRTFGAITTFGMQQIVSRAARNADELITGTAAARDEICAQLGIEPSRLAVVHHGPGRADPVEPAPEQEVRSRYDLDGKPVVLCVASKRPHKNQELLVRSLREPGLAEDVVLVLAGHPEPYDATLRSLAADLAVSDRVRFVDYVPDADLEALWRMAAVAAFPTRAEGFGLPVVEALARGVPVACSDIAVLREVGGEHVRLFSPDDPRDAARALAAAIAEPGDPSVRKTWAARFSWEEAARGTFAAYERAVAGA